MAGAPRGNAVFTVVVTALVLLCAVPMTLIVGVSSAPRVTVLAALLAAVPVGPLIACFLWLDRYEPEPRRLLVGGLLWGVFVATAIALLLEGVGGFVGGISDKGMLEIGAPVAEEASKGLFLLLLLWWRRAELDGVLDGIVYAGMVGVGFAFTENILYLASAYDGSGGVGPGGVDALDRHLRAALSGQPVRAPALHRLHRDRCRDRGQRATPLDTHPRSDRRVRRARCSPTPSGTPPRSSARATSWRSTWS